MADFNFVSDLAQRHKCPICLFAMKNPVQTECGHLFCKLCLEPILKTSMPMCPIDWKKLSRDETFPDNACQREICALLVYCNFKTSGCEWTGVLSQLENHLEKCGYQEIKCFQCGCCILQNLIKQHQSIECPMKPIACPHCGSTVPAGQVEVHIKTMCLESFHYCPNNCDQTLQMKLTELECHIDPINGDCPLTEIDCPFSHYGCQFKRMMRKELLQHMEVSSLNHSQLLIKEIQLLNEKLSRAEDILESDRMERHSERIAPRLLLLEDKMSQLQISMESVQRQTDYGFSQNSVHSMGGLHSIRTSSAYSSAIVQRVDSLYPKVTELDHTVNRYLSSSLDQDLRLQLLERATHDGMLLWKIDDFSRRKREAVDGITLSLYSTPFYTSHQGYKMCARVYLNGDGMGKSTHFSFFFVIMKGPYDALLPWPFRQKVTLMLINQESGHKNVIDSFRPDPDSNSFQRPIKRDMNIASGCPMFCRLDYLFANDFIKEDCIFLGVVVDTANIPQPLPPKLSGNPSSYYP